MLVLRLLPERVTSAACIAFIDAERRLAGVPVDGPRKTATSGGATQLHGPAVSIARRGSVSRKRR